MLKQKMNYQQDFIAQLACDCVGSGMETAPKWYQWIHCSKKFSLSLFHLGGGGEGVHSATVYPSLPCPSVPLKSRTRYERCSLFKRFLLVLYWEDSCWIMTSQSDNSSCASLFTNLLNLDAVATRVSSGGPRVRQARRRSFSSNPDNGS